MESAALGGGHGGDDWWRSSRPDRLRNGRLSTRQILPARGNGTLGHGSVVTPVVPAPHRGVMAFRNRIARAASTISAQGIILGNLLRA